jgi:NTP pyrophosphatase (non-canonical NTP hydrolase)
MNIKEYVNLAKRTMKAEMSIDDLELGIIGEFGEFVDVIKKVLFHKHNENDKMIKEAGDFMWYYLIYCEKKSFEVSFIKYNNNNINIMLNIKYMFHNIDLLLLERGFDPSSIYSCMIDILNHYDISIYEVFDENIDKLKLRYPDKYEDQLSKNRIA